MTAEQVVQGIGFGFAIVMLMAGAFWWGWECRSRLAEKLEYFRTTNRDWHAYDRQLRASPTLHVPLRAELHEISERAQH